MSTYEVVVDSIVVVAHIAVVGNTDILAAVSIAMAHFLSCQFQIVAFGYLYGP